MTFNIQNHSQMGHRRSSTQCAFGLVGVLVVSALLGAIPTPPAITKQPANQSASLGANISFRTTATGTLPLYFQWQFNQTNLPDKTNISLLLTNVQMTDAGSYSLVVTNLAGTSTSQIVHLNIDPTFTKITTGRIVTDIGTGVACAWGDYDNDGFADLFVSSLHQKNLLFHNNHDGTFQKVTNTLLTSEVRDGRGCSWVDYDNDGNLDLFVTSSDANGFLSENELFRNNGSGAFTKMTVKAVGAIVRGAGSSEAPVWADYDNDGFIDVFIARYGLDWLYHNGGGFFSAITNVLQGPALDDSYSAAWADYNNDGLPDLVVTVKSEPPANRLYLNSGGGTFTRVTSGSIFTDHLHSFGCAWGDYDNDGLIDLFVNNGGYIGLEKSFLYHNNGTGSFTRITNNAAGSIVTDTGMRECAWGDYDNDGFLDLFVTAGDDGSRTMTNLLYHNNGDGSFERIFTGSLVNDGGTFNAACAWGDYDNDGFLDLFVTRGNDETNLLYHNNGNPNAWIRIKLIGVLSNRSAIGAKVRVHGKIGGRTFWQVREINTGSGAGGGSLEAHFGLGDATNIDLVRIEWPSGIVQELTNVAPRRFLSIVEHQENATEPMSFKAIERSSDVGVRLFVSGNTGLQYLFEASTNLVNWTRLGVRTNLLGTVEFLDSTATNLNHRFYRATAP
jgi:hypothetical protein